ncbi:hypothetical protein D3C76_651520 [compost metagenome]
MHGGGRVVGVLQQLQVLNTVPGIARCQVQRFVDLPGLEREKASYLRHSMGVDVHAVPGRCQRIQSADEAKLRCGYSPVEHPLFRFVLP